MWFEIPDEHRDTHEALEMIRIDAEFAKACSDEVDAVKRKLWESDPVAFEALGDKSRRLQHELKEAVAAFDDATGEPKPLPISDDVLATVQTQFTEDHRDEIVRKLGRTLAYLKRQQVDDPRLPLYVLRIADGDFDRFCRVVTEARVDYRDIVVAAESLPV